MCTRLRFKPINTPTRFLVSTPTGHPRHHRQIARTPDNTAWTDLFLNRIRFFTHIHPTLFSQPVPDQDLQWIRRVVYQLSRSPDISKCQNSVNTVNQILDHSKKIEIGELGYVVLTIAIALSPLSDLVLEKTTEFINACAHKKYSRGVKTEHLVDLKLKRFAMQTHRLSNQIKLEIPFDPWNLGKLASALFTDNFLVTKIEIAERFEFIFGQFILPISTPKWDPIYLDNWLGLLKDSPQTLSNYLVTKLKTVDPSSYQNGNKQLSCGPIEAKLTYTLFRTFAEGGFTSPEIIQKKRDLARTLLSHRIKFSWISTALMAIVLNDFFENPENGYQLKSDLQLIHSVGLETFLTAMLRLTYVSTKSIQYSDDQLIHLYRNQPALNPSHMFTPLDTSNPMFNFGRHQANLGATLARMRIGDSPPRFSLRLIHLVIDSLSPNEETPATFLQTAAEAEFGCDRFLEAATRIKQYGLDQIFPESSAMMDRIFQLATRGLASTRPDVDDNTSLSFIIETTESGTELSILVGSETIKITHDLLIMGKKLEELNKKKTNLAQRPAPRDGLTSPSQNLEPAPLLKNTHPLDPSTETGPSQIPDTDPEALKTPLVNDTESETPRLQKPPKPQRRKEKPAAKPIDALAPPSSPIPTVSPELDDTPFADGIKRKGVKFEALIKWISQYPSFVRFENGGSHKIAVFRNTSGGEQRIPVGNPHSGSKSTVKVGTLSAILSQIKQV